MEHETIHSQLFKLSLLRPTFLATLSASEESPPAPNFLFILLFLSLSVKTLQIFKILTALTALSHPSRGVSNDIDQQSTFLFVYVTIKCYHRHPKWPPPGQRRQESSERFVLKRSLRLLLKLPLIDFALRKHKKVESFISGLLQSTVYVIICFSCFFFVSKKQLESLVSVGCDCCCTFQRKISSFLNFFLF